MLWADGALTMDIWQAAKNKNKGKFLMKDQDTHDFAKDAADLDPKELEQILTQVSELAKEARVSSRSSRTANSTTDNA
ncbi:hypothetical protein HWV62_41974 [Athelia sp. TMB]|nr:hypothetical protein HWV62_41974 [Athelia sp. TMB]